MNWDTAQGTWTELSGQLKAGWVRLAIQELHLIRGHLDELVGRLQQRYGHPCEEAEKEADGFVRCPPSMQD